MADAPNGGAPDSSNSGNPRRRRRGTRGGRNRRKRRDADTPKDAKAKQPDDLPDRLIEGASPPAARPAGEQPEKDRSRRRGSRGGRNRSRSDDGRKGRERKGRPVGRYSMCVHVHKKGTQIAVLEGRALVEHYVSRPQDETSQIYGNIYLGRVQNVLPGMEAAFVDIGTPKNAVLYRGDVQFDSEDIEGSHGENVSSRRIEQMLRPNQTLICQVTKNPIGTKGARLTQEVSLPGRFVVLVPNQPETYGISKRLPDDERRRLRRTLDEVKPEQHGLIVRTAAEGALADELQRDVSRLTEQWSEIEKQAKHGNAPELLYREPDMAVRIIREEFNRDYRSITIDDRALYTEVHDYVAIISPEMADRVEFYDADSDPLPLFERFHVHEQLHKAIDRKVWLPSGGSLVIDRAEALTVIDVNTGKNVGKSSLEETVYRNNLEAGEEIARQLRLRDIGGIIVIDFIDMEIIENRTAVLRSFKEALARDKTRTQVFEISDLGLVEMTRKRISEGLVESLSETCPTCGGRGFVFDEDLLGHRPVVGGVIEAAEEIEGSDAEPREYDSEFPEEPEIESASDFA
jgi:ribonuclease E